MCALGPSQKLDKVGIKNTTGVACHIGAVLVLLHYGFRPVSRILLAYSTSCHANDALLVQLGRMLSQLDDSTTKISNNNTNDNNNVDQEKSHHHVIDPSNFYKLLKARVGVSADHLYDTTTTWIKLLEYLLQHFDKPNSDLTDLPCLLDFMFQQPKIHSVLQQLYQNGDGISCIRCKELPAKRFPCPWSLDDLQSGIDVEPINLVSLLCQSLQARPLTNYTWKPPYSERLLESSNGSTKQTSSLDRSIDTNESTTRIQVQIDQLPSVWLISLPTRNTKTQDKQVDCVRYSIPLSFTIGKEDKVHQQGHADFIKVDSNVIFNIPDSTQYALIASILYATPYRNDHDTYSEEEEGGHVMTLVLDQSNGSNRDSSVDTQHWHLYNDERVTIVSPDCALELLQGIRGNLNEEENDNSDSDDDEEYWIHATLLVYQQHDQTVSQAVESLTEHALNELKSLDWATDPECAVGKRIRVQWSKQKWYSGIVTAFNNGLHEIEYDDGDVRRYDLSKKVFEWINK